MVIALLIVLHLGSLAWAWNLPFWMARDNQKRIRENGARDSLRGKFHRQHLLWRAAAVVAGAGLPWGASLWLGHHNGGAVMVGAGAYLALAAVWFVRRFNPELNLSRDPPKPEWYVSLSPYAARFDRAIVAFTRWALLTKEYPTEFAVSRKAAEYLEQGTRWLLIAAAVTAGPLWIGAVGWIGAALL